MKPTQNSFPRARLTRSYDVFDTCLVRKQPFPSDIFLDVGAALSGTLRPSLGPEYRFMFRDLRIKAEKLARAQSSHEEVSLYAIWCHLAQLIPDLHIRYGIDLELEIERESLTPHSTVLNEITLRRAEGARILFISDTYLPAPFLRQLLITHNFFVPGDGLYVSSEALRTKHTGNLYHHVFAHEDGDRSTWVHSGDNIHADIAMASRAGVRPRLVDAGTLSRFERALINSSRSRSTFPSRLAGAMRALRLRGSPTPARPARDYASSFLGPTLFILAHWILSQARSQSIDRLYFFSRDCYALHKVASILAPSFGDIECRYLQVSRQSLLLPSISDVSPDGISWLFRSWETPSIDRLLAKLELDLKPSDFGFTEGQELRSPDDIAHFWSVLKTDFVRHKLTGVINERRRNSLDFFKTQGILDDGRTGVVDLGWFLTCQASLRKLLRFISPEAEVRGFYLGLHSDRLPPHESGDAVGLFYSDPPDRRAGLREAEVFKRATLLEHLLACAPHGTVQRYLKSDESAGTVQTRPISNGTRQLHVTLTDLAEEFAQLAVDALGGEEPVGHAELIQGLLVEVFERPRPDWINVIGDVEISQDQNNFGSTVIAEPYGFRDAVYDWLPKRLRPLAFKTANKHGWLELSNAASPGWVRLALKTRAAAGRFWRRSRRRLRGAREPE